MMVEPPRCLSIFDILGRFVVFGIIASCLGIVAYLGIIAYNDTPNVHIIIESKPLSNKIGNTEIKREKVDYAKVYNSYLLKFKSPIDTVIILKMNDFSTIKGKVLFISDTYVRLKTDVNTTKRLTKEEMSLTAKALFYKEDYATYMANKKVYVN